MPQLNQSSSHFRDVLLLPGPTPVMLLLLLKQGM
jgi:hypothetical protein